MELRRSEFVGAQVGEELREQGGLGILLALGVVMIYVALRFQIKFSLGAVLALGHDVLIVLGVFSLLRAGSLAAPVYIVEERTVGPSLGQENIDLGVTSVQIGLLLVVAFMLIYYRVFGLFANLALSLNLVMLIAVMSMLSATLTLPGIAGIVLTVGMAVDANVLIFARINITRLRLAPAITKWMAN